MARYMARSDTDSMPVEGNKIKRAIEFGYKVYKIMEVEVTDPDAEMKEWEAEQEALKPNPGIPIIIDNSANI